MPDQQKWSSVMNQIKVEKQNIKIHIKRQGQQSLDKLHVWKEGNQQITT